MTNTDWDEKKTEEMDRLELRLLNMDKIDLAVLTQDLLEACRQVLKAVYFEKTDGQWYPTADFNDAVPILSQAIANATK